MNKVFFALKTFPHESDNAYYVLNMLHHRHCIYTRAGLTFVIKSFVVNNLINEAGISIMWMSSALLALIQRRSIWWHLNDGRRNVAKSRKESSLCLCICQVCLSYWGSGECVGGSAGGGGHQCCRLVILWVYLPVSVILMEGGGGHQCCRLVILWVYLPVSVILTEGGGGHHCCRLVILL